VQGRHAEAFKLRFGLRDGCRVLDLSMVNLQQPDMLVLAWMLEHDAGLGNVSHTVSSVLLQIIKFLITDLPVLVLGQELSD
jgi:hypothetical protein